MSCEVVRKNDQGCCDCVVERTTDLFRFRLNAGGISNTKIAAPERELFFLSGLCDLLFRLIKVSQTLTSAGTLWGCLDLTEGGHLSAHVVPVSVPRSIHDWTFTSSTCEAC